MPRRTQGTRNNDGNKRDESGPDDPKIDHISKPTSWCEESEEQEEDGGFGEQQTQIRKNLLSEDYLGEADCEGR